MPGRVLRFLKMMNAVSVCLFVLCCLHSLSFHSNAEENGGALTVVHSDPDNGGATVEVEDEGGASTEQGQEPMDIFYPTQDWQEVKEGQALPAGLHVRMNMETGRNEARLMEGDSGLKYWRMGDKEGMVNTDKKQYSQEELKQALKEFKTTKLDETDLERESEVKAKFRSYEELKSDFADMNMAIETDLEIITRLTAKLTNKHLPSEDIHTLLVDLEYYLHQIDNAMLFADMGGLPLILGFVNNSEEELVQSEAALVLGAAMQSNPKVQIAAIHADVLQVLLRMLSTQSSVPLRCKVLYALSSLCRHFPLAQKYFLDRGGLSVLEGFFQEPDTDKLRMKAVTLLNDLLIERASIEEQRDAENAVIQERWNQYQQIPLRETMVDRGWCDLVPTLLETSEHETRENTLNAMIRLHEPCRTHFQKHDSRLKVLRGEYLVLSREETSKEDTYFTQMLRSVDTMLSDINTRDEL